MHSICEPGRLALQLLNDGWDICDVSARALPGDSCKLSVVTSLAPLNCIQRRARIFTTLVQFNDRRGLLSNWQSFRTREAGNKLYPPRSARWGRGGNVRQTLGLGIRPALAFLPKRRFEGLSITAVIM